MWWGVDSCCLVAGGAVAIDMKECDIRMNRGGKKGLRTVIVTDGEHYPFMVFEMM